MGVKSLAVVALLSSAIFVSACAASGEASLIPAPTSASAAPGPGSTQPPSTDLTPVGGGGDISSLGKTTVPIPSGSGSGLLPGSSPMSSTGIPSRSTPPAADTGWQIYQNETYGFLVGYPSTYVIVQAKARTEPTPVAQVWFQDRAFTNSPTANLQPPQFAIDIYENPSRLGAEEWVNASKLNLPGSNFDMTVIYVGGVQGIRLTTSLLVAPNEFIYVAKDRFVFKITPLGPFSNQMLASFIFR